MKLSCRTDWNLDEIRAIYDRPLLELVYDAATVHRKYFDARKVQVSELLSIKTGGCPEDCSYCPQAARYHTGVKRHGLLDVEKVYDFAVAAKKRGASRVCLGAAWREIRDNSDFDNVCEMVRKVSDLGVEVCCTLGMLQQNQADRLKEAGLYAYNHNLDTSREYYSQVIGTRGYDDRLATLRRVRKAKLTVCSGGILGMGESISDRLEMLRTYATMETPPDSLPINTLVPVEGTPLGEKQKQEETKVSIWDLVRMIATTRLVLPKTVIRLSAGRLERGVTDHALCFMAGANSIFTGEKLLTTPNPGEASDQEMFALLGLEPKEPFQELSHHA